MALAGLYFNRGGYDMAIWNQGQPRKTGDYMILLEDGTQEVAHFFKCQITGQYEWSRKDGSYIYDNITGWMPYDGS